MNIGSHRHIVTVQQPTATAPDGDGSYTQTWTDATPATWYASIAPASASSLEHLAAGTVISNASHVVRGRYRPDITTQARLLYEARTLNVVAVANVDERDIELVLACVEVVA